MTILEQSKNTNTSANTLEDITNNLLEKNPNYYERNDIKVLKNILINPNSNAKTLYKCIFDLSYKLIYTTKQISNETFDSNKQFKIYTKLRLELRNHPNITEEILSKLKYDLSIKYIKDINILNNLAKSDDPFVKTILAQNHSTPASILKTLLKDKNDIVRLASLKHLDIDWELLKTLSQDDSIDIKIFVAKNLQTTSGILEHLVKTNDTNLDNAIENHHNVSNKVLEIINSRRDNAFESLLGF